MKSIMIISHSSGIAGPTENYENFLLRKGYNVIKISHPLDQYDNKQTIVTKNTKVILQKNRSNKSIFNLLWDGWFSIKQIKTIKPTVIVGANNFDTVCAILSRRVFGIPIKQIIYFAADFSEDRFENLFFDFLYLIVEKIALKNSDLVVSNTKRAEGKRLKLGLDKQRSLVIPNGVFLNSPMFTPKEIQSDQFVFVGNVTKEHGLYNLIEGVSTIMRSLVIIGQGDDLDRVLKLCESKNIKVELHRQKSHNFVIEYLQNFNGWGLAPYNNDSKWTYYCSPLKVNEYIASGLPVIMSSVPEISEKVKTDKLGIVYDENSFLKITKNLGKFDLSDFDNRASSFYQEYNLDNLYERIPIKNHQISSNQKKLPISAVMVIYNEQALLKRCLDSFSDLVDEIIVVHDGVCTDQSLEIAKRYGAKIFERQHCGQPEPHRIFTYKQAKHDWVLQIDADEYLSDQLRCELSELIKQDCTGYDFVWPASYQGKDYFGFYKTALFKKDKIYYIEVTHQYVKPRDPAEKIIRNNSVIWHKPVYGNFKWSIIKQKWKKSADIQTKQFLKPFPQVNTWNYQQDDWDSPNRLRIKYPLVLGIVATFVYHILDGLIKTVRYGSFFYLKAGLIDSIYYYWVFWGVIQYRYHKI